MEIVLKDAEITKSCVDELTKANQNIDVVRERIDYILALLDEYWAVNPDQHAFDQELRKSNEHLTDIVKLNEEFGIAVNNFANATVANSSHTV